MSKDIRSYFKTSAVSQKKISNSQEVGIKKLAQRKRGAVLVISDSDEESSPIKRRKPSKTNEKPKKNEDSKATSKYFPEEKVSAIDIFGARPIKRDNSRNLIKKTVTREDKEFHIDKDFESELLKLDGLDLDLTSKDITECSNNQQIIGGTHQQSFRETEKAANKKISPLGSKTDSKICIHDTLRRNKRIKLVDEIEALDNFKQEIISKSTEVNKSPLNKLKQYRKQSPSKQPQGMIVSPKKSPVKKTGTSPQKSISGKKVSVTKCSAKKSPSKKIGCLLQKIDSATYAQSNNKIGVLKDNTLGDGLLRSITNIKKCNEIQQLTKEIDKSTTKDTSLNNNNFSKDKESSRLDISSNKKNVSEAPSNLWVERYKPTTSKQIIGQQGEKSCVNKLMTWLRNWQQNQSGRKKLAKPSPWAKNDDGGYFKAALLSGPPGVGKTTTAHIVSRELNFDVVEFNASDTRSKKLLHQEVSELLSTNSLSPFFTGKADQVTKQHVLLMDEVDGMAGNEDRGGVQELIQLIRQSRIPIICMCNDRNHPKIRSLANYCFDLRFSKPRVEQIRGAMMSVCFKEKLKLNPATLTEIISSANHDIRLIMNHLSVLAMEKSSLANSTKHIKMGPWDVTRKIFSEEEHKSMSIYDKCDLFFHDYGVTPLFVQENYLNAVPHKQAAKNKVKKMELFASAAKSLSLGDLTEKSIRSHNAWSLLPVQAIFSSYIPGEVLEGHIGAQINFPAWFGKNSRQTKMSRLLQELTVHARLKISGNKEAMNLDYLTPLESSIVSPLRLEGSDGIAQALAVLSEYCLVREDIESLSELSSWPNTKNQFSEVESKVKAAFTRAYNKTSTPTPYASVPIKKGSKAEVENTNILLEEDDLMQDIDDEEDDPDIDAMIVVKKKKQPCKKVDKETAPSTSKGNKNAKRGRQK